MTEKIPIARFASRRSSRPRSGSALPPRSGQEQGRRAANDAMLRNAQTTMGPKDHRPRNTISLSNRPRFNLIFLLSYELEEAMQVAGERPRIIVIRDASHKGPLLCRDGHAAVVAPTWTAVN